MANVYLIGDSEKIDAFCDAEMVVKYYGHTPLNPLCVPEIWEIQEAMIDCADVFLLLKGWEASESASKQYQYATSDKSRRVLFYSPKSEKLTRNEFNALKELVNNG